MHVLRNCCYEQPSPILTQLPPKLLLLFPAKWVFITNSGILNIKNINVIKNINIIAISDILNIKNVL